MSNDDPISSAEIEARLQSVGRYSWFVRAGLGVILTAFLLSVVVLVPRNADSVASVVDVVLLPMIFVGMGLLLFGIGMHLHLMHLNVVRQLRTNPDSDTGSTPDEHDA